MKILVTGARGQLAGEVTRAAGTRGHQVEALDRTGLDITDFARVSEAVSGARPDIVINCAAYNDVDGAEANWQDAYLVNGIGVRNLAHACRDNDCILAHFSSDYVFDGGSERPYTIVDSPNPLTMYGRSKLLGEELLMSHMDRYYLIRTSWVFGEGKHSFPRKVLEWASKKDTLRIVDDQTASPSSTVDLAGAVMELIETKNYGLYHMTNSGHCNRYEWASLILETANWQGRLEPAKSEEFGTPAKRPEYSVLDTFPLEQVIGSPLPTWQEATERLLRKLL
jgi:dTDP-4-dehydrorhamnose reductase